MCKAHCTSSVGMFIQGGNNQMPGRCTSSPAQISWRSYYPKIPRLHARVPAGCQIWRVGASQPSCQSRSADFRETLETDQPPGRVKPRLIFEIPLYHIRYVHNQVQTGQLWHTPACPSRFHIECLFPIVRTVCAPAARGIRPLAPGLTSETHCLPRSFRKAQCHNHKGIPLRRLCLRPS